MAFRKREFPPPEVPGPGGGWELVLEAAVQAEQEDPTPLRRILLKLTFLDRPLIDRLMTELPSLVLHDVAEDRARSGYQMLQDIGASAKIYPVGRWHKLQLEFSDAYPEHRRATELVASRLEAAGASSTEQTAIEAALREAIANASIHGNDQDPDKMIEVLYLQSGRWIEIAVSDQGGGFDFQPHLQEMNQDIATLANERLNQGRIGGLGLAMIQRCTDRMHFEPPGNRIRFAKELESVDENGSQRQDDPESD